MGMLTSAGVTDSSWLGSSNDGEYDGSNVEANGRDGSNVGESGEDCSKVARFDGDDAARSNDGSLNGVGSNEGREVAVQGGCVGTKLGIGSELGLFACLVRAAVVVGAPAGESGPHINTPPSLM